MQTKQFFWRYLRRIVPVALYPYLAIPYRWVARRTVRRLEKEDERYLQQHPDVIVPPALLRFKVVGACSIEHFLSFGEDSVDCLQRALQQAGGSFETAGRVLDFGCGCGRAALAFLKKFPAAELHGADVDAQAIDWCRAEIESGEFKATDPLPPLPYPDDFFDVVWTISVFTHLDEERQFRWLEELQRVTKPGGFLVATVHGRHLWDGLPQATVKKIEEDGFLFAKTAADQGLHPEWYQVAWHTEDYVRQEWTKYYDVSTFVPVGHCERQDIVVGQRRTT